MPKSVFSSSEAKRMFAEIDARHDHLLNKAMPIAMKLTMDSVLAQARTKSIGYIRNRAKVPRWVIARKLPTKLQRKASLKDFYRRGKMTSKSQIILSDVQGITILSKKASGAGGGSAPPVVDQSKMARLAQSTKGIKLGKAGNYPNAFVADGKRRETDPKYNQRLISKLGAGPKVLRGKHWQVLQRDGSAAYPVSPITIPIAKYAGVALRRYSKAIFNSKGVAIYESKEKYVMNEKVKF
jgi:hypothetical protein